MKRIQILLLVAFTVMVSFWPQVPTKAQEIGKHSKVSADSLNRRDAKAKQNFLSNFDEMDLQIKRISALPAKIITRTKTSIRKVDHYRIDTFLVYIDTCFSRPMPETIITDTIYPLPKKQNWLQKTLDNILHRRRP